VALGHTLIVQKDPEGTMKSFRGRLRFITPESSAVAVIGVLGIAPPLQVYGPGVFGA